MVARAGKIHVRVPTGLTTVKYCLGGGGHVVADDAAGSRLFTHRSIDREWKGKL
ncbi:MAG: hypothetical protein NWE88_12110 [Candidatus Bathyarchaeota archaeon]|nr:hypothetical protein [Candidatus Bathyarchaeota archaeon]